MGRKPKSIESGKAVGPVEGCNVQLEPVAQKLPQVADDALKARPHCAKLWIDSIGNLSAGDEQPEGHPDAILYQNPYFVE